jgi:hypothetical protein
MPYITLSKVSDGLDSYFNSLDRALSTQVFQNKLPLLGNGLSNSSSNQFVSRMRSSVQRELQAITSSGAYYNGDVEVGEIGKALFKALGNGRGGLGILQDLDGNGIISAADVQITDRQTSTGSGYGGYVDFNLKLKQSPALFDVPISKDLGLSKLGLTLDGNARASIGYLYNLNFGLEFSGVGYYNNDSFYVETAASNELEIVLAAITPNSNITGKLGLLQVQAKDQGTELKGSFSVNLKDSNDADTKLTASELQSIGSNYQDLIDASFNGSADINFNLTTGFSGAVAKFPSLSTDFRLNWTFANSKADPNQPQSFGGIPQVSFNNVKLKMGDFLNNFVSPVFGEIQKVTQPIQPIVDFLNKPLPVLSDFGKPQKPVTLLDLAPRVDPKADLRFVKALGGFIQLANSLPKDGSNLAIDLGSFSFGNADVRAGNFDSKSVAPTVTAAAPSLSEQLKGNPSTLNFVNKTQDPNSATGKIAFPILTDPNVAFSLLLGKTDSTLFSYRMPTLSFRGNYGQTIPILGPLGVKVTGTIGSSINLEFGFDAFGLNEYAKSNNTEDLFNGFFVDADPRKPAQVSVFAGLDAGPGVDLVVASLFITGGILGTIDFRLKDNNGDKKARFSELANNFNNNPLNLFNTSGRIDAGLKARASIAFIPYEQNILFGKILDYGGREPAFKQFSQAGSRVGKVAKQFLSSIKKGGKYARAALKKADPFAGRVLSRNLKPLSRLIKTSPAVAWKGINTSNNKFWKSIDKVGSKGLRVIEKNNPKQFFTVLSKPAQVAPVLRKLEVATAKPFKKIKSWF